jgi:uncharacterized SAM-binding protein YcdF (DUF218 family)
MTLTDPLFIFWSLLIIALAFFFVKRYTLTRWVSFASAAWLFLSSISPLPIWMARNLERKYPVVDPSKITDDKPVLILVLGGGYSFAPDLNPGNQLSLPAQSRIAEAIRLYRQIPGSKIVCSGSSVRGLPSQAETTALAALESGVPPSDTLTIKTPTDTFEEAQAFKHRFDNRYNVILVTSAVHMKRALLTFEKFGMTPIPAPSNFLVRIDPNKNPYHFKPSAEKIKMMDRALHEYLGLVELWFK